MSGRSVLIKTSSKHAEYRAKTSLLDCHPEACFGPELVEGTSRDISDLFALRRLFCGNLWPKSRGTASKSGTSREVPSTSSGPKQGLRMTDLFRSQKRTHAIIYAGE